MQHGYRPLFQYVGQATVPVVSSSLADPLANVPSDQAAAAGFILGTNASFGLFIGGILAFAWNPRIGIPRWLFAVLGGAAGLAVGAAVGSQQALAQMPSLSTNPPTAAQWWQTASQQFTPSSLANLLSSSASPSTSSLSLTNA